MACTRDRRWAPSWRLVGTMSGAGEGGSGEQILVATGTPMVDLLAGFIQ